jgi:photosystem II stability/assembly factor-like uncharacterized protein
LAEAKIKITTHLFLKKKFFLFFLILTSFIIIAFNFTDLTSGWYQQNLPDLGSRQLIDITFTDSLTGYGSARQDFDTSYILKTTNGGDNWQIIYRNFLAMERIQFLNKDTGFTCGAYLFKTTNGGFNWIQLNTPSISPEDLYVLNNDTIWIISPNSLVGGVFRTTNGGLNWTQQFGGGSQNPDRIYMYNARIGFMYNNSAVPKIYKTTNSGLNWNVIVNDQQVTNDIKFTDSLTGWKGSGNYVYKTTDGGIVWKTQYLPSGSEFVIRTVYEFSVLNKDTIWAAGGVKGYPNNQTRGMIYRTTNGGDNWLYQIPDTSINNFIYYHIQFINKTNGWAYFLTRGVHTTTGGDPVWLTDIRPISNEIPDHSDLYQNYPNPFNPSTTITYSLKNNSHIKLIIYDIRGKEILTAIDKNQSSGSYSYVFDGTMLSAGVYFYRLETESMYNKYTETKKMILVK